MKKTTVLLLGIMLLCIFSCNSKECLEEYSNVTIETKSIGYKIDNFLPIGYEVDNGLSIEYKIDDNFILGDITTRSFYNVLDGSDIIFVGDTVEYILPISTSNPYYSAWVESDFRTLRKVGEHSFDFSYGTYVSQYVVEAIDAEYKNIPMRYQIKIGSDILTEREKIIKIYRNKPTILGADVLCDCDNSITFNLAGLPSEATSINWYSNIGSVISGQGSSEVTFSVNTEDYDCQAEVFIKIKGGRYIYEGYSYDGIFIKKNVHKGEPVIESRFFYENLIITNRNEEAYIANPVVYGISGKANWNLISGNATLRETDNGVYIKSLKDDSESDIIEVSANTANNCGTNTKMYEIESAAINTEYRPVDSSEYIRMTVNGWTTVNIEIDISDRAGLGSARLSEQYLYFTWIDNTSCFVRKTSTKVGNKVTNLTGYTHRLKFNAPYSATRGTSVTMRLYIGYPPTSPVVRNQYIMTYYINFI